MDDKFKLLTSELGESRIKRDIDVTEFLQNRLGGVALFSYIATTEKELIKAINLCRNLKIFGIKGKVSKSGLGVEEALIEAGSGVSLKRLNDYVKSQGLGGLECFE